MLGKANVSHSDSLVTVTVCAVTIMGRNAGYS
jgi:hypothetical protein